MTQSKVTVGSKTERASLINFLSLQMSFFAQRCCTTGALRKDKRYVYTTRAFTTATSTTVFSRLSLAEHEKTQQEGKLIVRTNRKVLEASENSDVKLPKEVLARYLCLQEMEFNGQKCFCCPPHSHCFHQKLQLTITTNTTIRISALEKMLTYKSYPRHTTQGTLQNLKMQSTIWASNWTKYKNRLWWETLLAFEKF